MGIEINVANDTATPKLEKLAQSLGSLTPINRRVGVRVETFVKDHFASVNVPRGNSRGWRSTGFWQKARKSVSSRGDEAGATVAIAQEGVALQRFGKQGLKPREKKYLTIPVSPNAYGEDATDFDKTFFWKSPKGNLFIARSVLNGRGRNASRGIELLYLLKQSVNVKPNPDVMPSDEAIKTEAVNEIDKAVKEAMV